MVHLYAPPPMQGTGLGKTLTAMRKAIEGSTWSPLEGYGSGPRNAHVNIWPDMSGPLGCIRIFTAPWSIVTGRIVRDAYKVSRVKRPKEDYTQVQRVHTRPREAIIYDRDVHIWTDGSADKNRKDECMAGSAWVSDMQLSDKVSLAGAVLSNNVAEVAAVVLCLLAWRNAHIVIHTDSTYVLGLLKGGLLAMERDGWGDAPRHMSRGPGTPLLQLLLYLLQDRTGRLDFVKAKAHSSDNMNNLADALANKGRMTGQVFNIGTIRLPAGWVDTSPVLCHQPLDFLTKLAVRASIQSPTTTLKFGIFSDRWTVTISILFDVVLDPGSHIGNVWKLTIPEGMKEVLWKEMNSVQVLGHRYYGTGLAKSDMARFCACGEEMSLQHILLGCGTYKLQPLMDVLTDILQSISPSSSFRTLHPDEWGHSPWYPLLALKEIEENALPIFKGRKVTLKALKKSRQRREWVIGNYYWALWKWRMKEIHEEKFKFMPQLCADLLRGALLTPVPAHLLRVSGDGEDPPAKTGLNPAQAQADIRDGSTSLPPPISLITGSGTGSRPPRQGKPSLCAITVPLALSTALPLTTRERILRALTDDAYA